MLASPSHTRACYRVNAPLSPDRQSEASIVRKLSVLPDRERSRMFRLCAAKAIAISMSPLIVRALKSGRTDSLRKFSRLASSPCSSQVSVVRQDQTTLWTEIVVVIVATFVVWATCMHAQTQKSARTAWRRFPSGT